MVFYVAVYYAYAFLFFAQKKKIIAYLNKKHNAGLNNGNKTQKILAF